VRAFVQRIASFRWRLGWQFSPDEHIGFVLLQFTNINSARVLRAADVSAAQAWRATALLALGGNIGSAAAAPGSHLS
jgi:hypothetical protein